MSNEKSTSTPVVTITLDTEVDGWIEYDDETGEPIGRGRTIADAIVSDTVQRLVSTLDREVKSMIREQLREAISTQVAGLVAETIANPVQLTNQFGERTGKEETVRQHIATEVQKQLSQRGSSFDSRDSVITSVLRKEVQDALSKELRDSVIEARNIVVSAVKNQASAILAKAIRDGLNS